jgi:uncharacterized protein (DUF2141 family)
MALKWSRALRALLALLFLFLIPSAAAAADGNAPAGCVGHPGPIHLWVNVLGLRSSDGLVAVTVYADDSSKFLAKRGSLYVGRTPAHAPSTRVCIFLPHTGIFALAVYHDRNANRRFDRNAIGLPAEPGGFSNNPSTFFGLPSFSAVRLNVPRNGMSTDVRLKNR